MSFSRGAAMDPDQVLIEKLDLGFPICQQVPDTNFSNCCRRVEDVRASCLAEKFDPATSIGWSDPCRLSRRATKAR